VFKVIDLLPEGKLEESEDPARVAPPPPGVRRWIELLEPDPPSLDLLRTRFDFHPLAIEDCASFELRSKLEEYNRHLFIVLHTFTAPATDPEDLRIHEVHAFLADDFLVTVHDNPVPATEQVFIQAASNPGILERGTAWAFYRVADAMVDGIFPVLDGLVRRVEAIETDALHSPDTHKAIFGLRSTLVSMKRVLRPLRDVSGILTRRADAPMDQRCATYFRDIQDHVLRSLETIEETEGLIANVVDAYRYELSNRTNAIMAKLTIFSAIFLPLGFITGFFGQNFDAMPFGSHALLYGMLAAIVAVPAGLLVWFARKGWM
jgi:magnesium transporter